MLELMAYSLLWLGFMFFIVQIWGSDFSFTPTERAKTSNQQSTVAIPEIMVNKDQKTSSKFDTKLNYSPTNYSQTI